MLFTLKQTLKATKVTERELKYWVETGDVVPSKQGKRNAYTKGDLFTLCLLRELKSVGIVGHNAAWIICDIKTIYEKYFQTSPFVEISPSIFKQRALVSSLGTAVLVLDDIVVTSYGELLPYHKYQKSLDATAILVEIKIHKLQYLLSKEVDKL